MGNPITGKGITLIGMARAGKSTLGPILAKKVDWPLYDVDLIMIEKEQKRTGHIVRSMGRNYLISLESQTVAALSLYQSILVTPGSIVYDGACHPQLKTQTHIVWLDTPMEVIAQRLLIMPNDNGEILGLEEHGLEYVFNERRPLYQALANTQIDTLGKTPNEIADEVIYRVLR